VLDLYRRAKTVNSSACFKIIAHWNDKVESADREFWNQALFEVDKSNLDFECFRYECIRNIGAMIEACLQPYLRTCLCLYKLTIHRSDPIHEVEKLTLGSTVAQLARTFKDSELLSPHPWNIPLNQWRNIAQHHSAHIEGDLVVVTYKGEGRTISVSLTRAELLQAFVTIQTRLAIFRGADALFFCDNLEEARAALPSASTNDSSRLFHLHSAFAVQGFQVISVKRTPNEIRFALQDLHSIGEPKRIIHCSQFVVPIWLHYKIGAVTIDYLDSRGEPVVKISATGEDIKLVTVDEAINWEKLADVVKFEKV
jgi:hypothetical protein